MASIKKRIVTSIVVSFLLVGTLSAFPISETEVEADPPQMELKNTSLGIVFDYEEVKSKCASNIEKVSDYPGFTVIRAGSRGFDELEQKDLGFKRLDQNITTPRGKLDPENKSMNRGWRSSDAYIQARDPAVLSLIRFRGPLKKIWKEKLESSDVQIMERVGDLTYQTFCSDDETLKKLEDLPFVKEVLPYEPAYKVGDELLKTLDNVDERKDPVTEPLLNLALYRGMSEKRLRSIIKRLGGGVVSYSSGELKRDYSQVKLPAKEVKDLACYPRVLSIHREREFKLFNKDSSWVIQSYEPGDYTRALWDRGIYGRDQVVGASDTGIDYDHAMFRDTKDSAGSPGSDHRKVVMYQGTNDNDNDNSGHGTHVAGSIAGDWKEYGEPDKYDGMAPGAKIAFYDIGDENDQLNIPDDVTKMFQPQYDKGARIFTNSWGQFPSQYSSRAQQCDEFMWNHNDALIFFAAGNGGPNPSTIGDPATAKNLVSVGATVNRVSDDMAEFSSHGPGPQGRLNPTVSAPGLDIISADSDGSLSSMNDGLYYMSGTSMASPIMAGGTALVRQYYNDGWYPSGVENPSQGFSPSGSLLKATLINSASNMDGKYTSGSIPSMGQGWGKITFDDTLYFEGDERRLDILNKGKSGGISSSGEDEIYEVYSGEGEELKVTLTWTDYPGKALQNDLDLVVEAPDGTQYVGNVFGEGRSVPGGEADDLNVEEQVLIPSKDMQEGKYTVKVVGQSISEGPQKYSLLASGDVVTDRGKVFFDNDAYNEPPAVSEVGIKVADLGGNVDSTTKDTVEVQVTSTTESEGESFTLTETGPDTALFRAQIPIEKGSPKADGILQISNQDELKAKYFDDSISNDVTDTSEINGRIPVIKSLNPPTVKDGTLISEGAEISWTTMKETKAVFKYGKTPELGKKKEWNFLTHNHSIFLKDLEPNTTYYYKIISVDNTHRSNVAVHDNDGALHSFSTPSWPQQMGEGYSGYVYDFNDPGKASKFHREVIYVGYDTYHVGPMYGAVMFDVPQISDLESASLRLHPLRSYRSTNGSEQWSFEVLGDGIEDSFPDPSFDEIKNANNQFTIGTTTTSELAGVHEVDLFDIDQGDLDALKNNMNDGNIVIRIKGPTSGDENKINGWFTGHHLNYEKQILKGPQLRLNSAREERGYIGYSRDHYTPNDHAHIYVEDPSLNADPDEIGYITVSVSSSLETEDIQLKETGANTARFEGTVEISDSQQSSDGILQVTDQDTISVEYDDGGVKREDTASIDSTSPSISSLRGERISGISYTINWTTDEPATSKVYYGSSEDMVSSVYDEDLTTDHSIKIPELIKNQDYFYQVESIDEAGNRVLDDNSGNLYRFSLQEGAREPKILLVDDDFGSDYEKYFQEAMDANGYEYDTTTGSPSVERMSDYPIIIWQTGYIANYSVETGRTLCTEDVLKLMEYLDKGGRLFLNSQEYLYNAVYQEEHTPFYQDYLGVESYEKYNDITSPVPLNGVSGDPISDGMHLETSEDMYGNTGIYADRLNPSNASVIFEAETSGNNRVNVKNDGENFKTVFFTYPFETIVDKDSPNTKKVVMKRIVNWLMDGAERFDNKGPLSEDLEVDKNTVVHGQEVTFSGTMDDTVAYKSDISSIEYFMDDIGEAGEGEAVQPADGSFDSSLEGYSDTIDSSKLALGEHIVYVHGKDEAGNWGEYSTASFTVKPPASEINIELIDYQTSEGWNFISSSLIPSETDLEELLNDPESGIKGNYDKVMYYDSLKDEWKTYLDGRADHYNSLQYFDETMGIWIHMTGSDDLTISGVEPVETEMTIKPGWNMVGYPSTSKQNAARSLPKEVDKIGIFNSNEPDNIEYISDLTSVDLKPGEGYWIHNGASYEVKWGP